MSSYPYRRQLNLDCDRIFQIPWNMASTFALETGGVYFASRSTWAASFAKSISSPAAGTLRGSKYQAAVALTVPPGGMVLRGPCGSSSQAGTCSAFGYQKHRVSPAISG